ncbi:hypothetical protein [Aporhodopirellula aestuarii]|uniref:DUF4199 domain-containing protein n=1 Tax=Aporhodopirellula aestuarii TaxID=2950107 RepID=A0ABT0UCJ4_9BACT|nr:hypothetical protein [Aporhodopirellula aestuarii]MCM2374727.1 hypothetical protein [Aporhodopirellula aestuarii]
MQISIRILLAIVAMLAICVAGALNGPPIAWVAATLLGVAFVMQAINAAIGSGNRRSFAIGLLIPSAAYLLLTFVVSEHEYATSNGRLPTTQLFQSMARSKYSDQTMKLKDFSNELRGVRDTMPLGHLCVAMTLGIAGGYYALWIRRRDIPDAG